MTSFDPDPPSGTMESGTGAWSTDANTDLSQSSIQANSGSFSLRLEKLGTGGPSAGTPVPPAVGALTALHPGEDIEFGAWAYIADVAGLRAGMVLFFYDSADSLITLTSAVVEPAANTWAELSGTVAVPANAATVAAALAVTDPEADPIPDGTVVFYDDVYYQLPSSEFGGGWRVAGGHG